MGDFEQVTAELNGSVADLAQQVEVIQGGWELLMESNVEITIRIDSLDRNMSMIQQTLARMEANQFQTKNNGKLIATSSQTTSQVRSDPLNLNLENDSLGDRGISQVMENRKGLLKKVELPVFDGSSPFIWLRKQRGSSVWSL